MCKVTFRDGQIPGACYSSGSVIFDEQLHQGRLLPRYWSPQGQILPEQWLRIDSSAHAYDSFGLQINQQDLSGGYVWEAAEITPDPSSYPAGSGPVTHGVIALHHPARGIGVRVHTRLDGSPFIIRWLEITNVSGEAVAITGLAPFSGLLWQHHFQEHLPPGQLPFAAAYSHRFEWGQEGDFWFEPLGEGVRVVDGERKGRSGWGRPAFWARDHCNGQTFVCELAWGGNYEFALACTHRQAAPAGLGPTAALSFRMGLAGCSPALRVVEAGETVITPAVHLGLFAADVDEIVQANHTHVRQVILPPGAAERTVDIEANHRGYLCDRENEAGLKQDIDVASAVGAEMYVVDAGWYGRHPNRWFHNVGDWFAGAWLEHGLEPVADYARHQGMKFGLWAEIEAAGSNSRLREEHPDWLLTRDGQPVAEGRALNLALPPVAAWVESEIARLITQYRLDMFRIDHNHRLAPFGNRQCAGFAEDLGWRYYEALYGIMARIRARFPGVILQNCAGGGGRLDWGTLHYFHNTELSDWARAPRALKILNNISLCLPPEILLRVFGTEVGEHALDADVDTQLRLACLARPIFRGIAPSLETLTPYLRARIEHHLTVFRDFIRPLMAGGCVFHHTPFLPLFESQPLCVLEYAAADASRAVGAIFRLPPPAEAAYTFRPRGLDVGKSYRVTLDNAGQTFTRTGSELRQAGVRVELEQPQSSELLLFTVVGSGEDGAPAE